jgi:hypothetical protein
LKSARDNIKENELKALREEAKDKLALPEKQIEAMLEKGSRFEIIEESCYG